MNGLHKLRTLIFKCRLDVLYTGIELFVGFSLVPSFSFGACYPTYITICKRIPSGPSKNHVTIVSVQNRFKSILHLHPKFHFLVVG